MGIFCALGLMSFITCCCTDDSPIETPSISWIDKATPVEVLPANDLIGDDWQLEFSDEFNDGAVDFNKWTILDQNRGSVTKHGINEWWFKVENVSESDGNLILKNTKVGDDMMYCGSVYSNKKYYMQYGYAEARIKVADTRGGALTAFWLQSNTMGNIDGSGNDGAEVDIFESAYVDDHVISTIHFDGYADDHQEKNFQYVTPDLFDGYHIWGCLWDEESIKIYYDGRLTAEFDGKWVPQVEEYLYLSTVATFGNGAIDFRNRKADSYLSEALFDYVRVWVKPQSENTETQSGTTETQNGTTGE